MGRSVKIKANHFKVACTLTRASLPFCIPLLAPALVSNIQGTVLYHNNNLRHVLKAGGKSF